jgi:hypothetical protein
MRPGQLLIGIAICGLLTSCAGSPGNGDVDWDHGARRARVLEVLGRQAAATEARACAPAGWDWQAERSYVLVRYRNGHRLHHNTVAAVPEGLALRPGDQVELWPEDCGERRLARVGRLLAAPPRER